MKIRYFFLGMILLGILILLLSFSLPARERQVNIIEINDAITPAFFVFAVSLALKAQMAKPASGREGLIGERGVAQTRLDPEGKVFVHGELWNAYSEGAVGEGEKIQVLKMEGLKLKVQKLA